MTKHSIEYDRQDFKSVTLYMLKLFGADILRDSRRIYAIFRDLSPKLKPYANVMRQLAEHGVLAELVTTLNDGGIRQDRAMMKARTGQ